MMQAGRAEILKKAENCVSGCADKYGNPEDNFDTIAKFWSVYKGVDISPVDVAMMMSLLKIARVKSGKALEDSFVDLAGYAACGGAIAANERENLLRPLNLGDTGGYSNTAETVINYG